MNWFDIPFSWFHLYQIVPYEKAATRINSRHMYTRQDFAKDVIEMKRSSIRGSKSENQPRICDYVRNDDGEEVLEFKYQGRKISMRLSDFTTAVKAARKV